MKPLVRKYFITLGIFLAVVIPCMAAAIAYVYWHEQQVGQTSRPSPAVVADLRQHLLTDLTEHCLKGARSANEGVPDQKNIDYCNCAMPRALAQISDDDIGSPSTPEFKAEVRAKMQAAGRVCSEKIFPKEK